VLEGSDAQSEAWMKRQREVEKELKQSQTSESAESHASSGTGRESFESREYMSRNTTAPTIKPVKIESTNGAWSAT